MIKDELKDLTVETCEGYLDVLPWDMVPDDYKVLSGRYAIVEAYLAAQDSHFVSNLCIVDQELGVVLAYNVEESEIPSYHSTEGIKWEEIAEALKRRKISTYIERTITRRIYYQE